MYCKNCGLELDPNSRFCGNCGSVVSVVDDNQIQNDVELKNEQSVQNQQRSNANDVFQSEQFSQKNQSFQLQQDNQKNQSFQSQQDSQNQACSQQQQPLQSESNVMASDFVSDPKSVSFRMRKLFKSNFMKLTLLFAILSPFVIFLAFLHEGISLSSLGEEPFLSTVMLVRIFVPIILGCLGVFMISKPKTPQSTGNGLKVLSFAHYIIICSMILLYAYEFCNKYFDLDIEYIGSLFDLSGEKYVGSVFLALLHIIFIAAIVPYCVYSCRNLKVTLNTIKDLRNEYKISKVPLIMNLVFAVYCYLTAGFSAMNAIVKSDTHEGVMAAVLFALGIGFVVASYFTLSSFKKTHHDATLCESKSYLSNLIGILCSIVFVISILYSLVYRIRNMYEYNGFDYCYTQVFFDQITTFYGVCFVVIYSVKTLSNIKSIKVALTENRAGIPVSHFTVGFNYTASFFCMAGLYSIINQLFVWGFYGIDLDLVYIAFVFAVMIIAQVMCSVTISKISNVVEAERMNSDS